MATKNFFSIITCTRNSDKYLNRAIESLKKQKFKKFEHIFIEGHSTDNTLKIINEYKKNNPGRIIKIIKSKPIGIAHAMNLGIRNSNGEVIYFLHSDDYLISKNSLNDAYNLFNKYRKYNWIMGLNVSNNNGKVKVIKHRFKNKKLFLARLIIGNIISHANTFLKRRVYLKYGLFNEDYKISMDYEYWLRIINKEDFLLANKKFASFTIHELGASSNKKNIKLREKEDISAIKANICKNYIFLTGRNYLSTLLKMLTKIKEIIK